MALGEMQDAPHSHDWQHEYEGQSSQSRCVRPPLKHAIDTKLRSANRSTRAQAHGCSLQLLYEGQPCVTNAVKRWQLPPPKRVLCSTVLCNLTSIQTTSRTRLKPHTGPPRRAQQTCNAPIASKCKLETWLCRQLCPLCSYFVCKCLNLHDLQFSKPRTSAAWRWRFASVLPL